MVLIIHELKSVSKDNLNGGEFYHCLCGEFYTKNKDEFIEHMRTGEIPIGRGEFKVVELFPKLEHANVPSPTCTEFGCMVTLKMQVLHTKWHNKVANL
jgi:hypothetical protein